MTDEELEALEARVTALETIVSGHTEELEGSYELLYSGEQDDESIGNVLDLTVSPAEINTIVGKWLNVSFVRAPADYLQSALSNSYALTVVNSSVDKISKAVNRTYPLIMKWQKVTVTITVKSDDGWQRSAGTVQNIIPASITDTAVIAVCDNANSYFNNVVFGYAVSGRNVDWSIAIDHSSSQGGTYAFSLYFLVLGKNSGGGTIG